MSGQRVKPPDEAILNEQLRQARDEKGLTQQQVAEIIGAQPNNYSRWERGAAFPGSYYRKKLSKLFDKSEQELGLVRQARTNAAKTKASSVYTTLEGFPLLGRDQDIKEIFARLEEKRFVVLVGPPGIGKRELVWQIKELAPTRGYPQILDIPIIAKQGMSIDETLRMIKNKLDRVDPQKKTLVTLDNCEDIADIDRASTEMHTFLHEHKQLSLLAASRVSFTEPPYVYEVRPLTVPFPSVGGYSSLDELLKYDGVRLFIERAKEDYENKDKTERDIFWDAVGIAKEAWNERGRVADICIALDGVPLALKQAAAWVYPSGMEKVFNQVLDRTILNKPATSSESQDQQTLSQRLDAIYTNKLNEPERKLFRRLAVFPCPYSMGIGVLTIEQPASEEVNELIKRINKDYIGLSPYTTHDAAVICNLGDFPELEDETTFTALLTKLRINCLISVLNDRVETLNHTIRDFGRSKLESVGEGEAMRSNYIDYYSRREFEIYTTVLYNQAELKNFAEARGFLDGENTGYYAHEMPEHWSEALRELVYKYMKYKHSDDSSLSTPLYAALRRVIEEYPNDKDISHDILKMLDKLYREECLKQLREEAEDTKEFHNKSQTVPHGLHITYPIWGLWDKFLYDTQAKPRPGTERPQAVFERQIHERTEYEHTFTSPDSEYYRYRELLSTFFEKFTRWKQILAADEYAEYVPYVRWHGFSIFRADNGPVIRAGTSRYKDRPREDDPDKILEISRDDNKFRPDNYDSFDILPGPAGKHLLGEALSCPVGFIHISAEKTFDQLRRQSIDILLHDDREDAALPRQKARYYTWGKTIAILNKIGDYAVMTDEQATRLITTIDSLIPRTNT